MPLEFEATLDLTTFRKQLKVASKLLDDLQRKREAIVGKPVRKTKARARS